MYCANVLQRRVDEHDSCLAALYDREMEEAKKLCSIRAHKAAEFNLKINARQMALYAKDTEVSVKCLWNTSSEETTQLFLVRQNITIISLPKFGDCTAYTKNFKMKAYDDLEVRMDTRSVAIKMTTRELTGVSKETLGNLLDPLPGVPIAIDVKQAIETAEGDTMAGQFSLGLARISNSFEGLVIDKILGISVAILFVACMSSIVLCACLYKKGAIHKVLKRPVMDVTSQHHTDLQLYRYRNPAQEYLLKGTGKQMIGPPLPFHGTDPLSPCVHD